MTKLMLAFNWKGIITTSSKVVNQCSVRQYQPYRDLGKFRSTSTGDSRTTQLEQFMKNIFRRADDTNNVPKGNAPNTITLGQFMKAFFKKN